MLDMVLKVLLMLMAPAMKLVAHRIPDEVLKVMMEVGPVVDALQREMEAEASRRKEA